MKKLPKSKDANNSDDSTSEKVELIIFDEVALDIFERIENGKKVIISDRYNKGTVGALPISRAQNHIKNGEAHKVTKKEMPSVEKALLENLRKWNGKS